MFPGATVVINARATNSTPRLRVQRAPGIPRSLHRVAPRPLFLGEKFINNSGAMRGEKAGLYPGYPRRCEHSKAIHSLLLQLPHGLLRFARKDGFGALG